jgi:glycosyltransferase involved in cell wall biosynthesis
VASDIPALREVGGDAAEYRPVGDVDAWTRTILQLIGERDTAPAVWQARKRRGVARAAQFSWSTYASAVAAVYRSVADRVRK